MNRLSLWLLLGLALFALSCNDVFVSAEVVPTESECRPYIEKAINELKTGDQDDDDDDGEHTTGPPADEDADDDDDNAQETTSTENDDDVDEDENKTLETIEIADVESIESEAIEAFEAEVQLAETFEAEVLEKEALAAAKKEAGIEDDDDDKPESQEAEPAAADDDDDDEDDKKADDDDGDEAKADDDDADDDEDATKTTDDDDDDDEEKTVDDEKDSNEGDDQDDDAEKDDTVTSTEAEKDDVDDDEDEEKVRTKRSVGQEDDDDDDKDEKSAEAAKADEDGDDDDDEVEKTDGEDDGKSGEADEDGEDKSPEADKADEGDDDDDDDDDGKSSETDKAEEDDDDDKTEQAVTEADDDENDEDTKDVDDDDDDDDKKEDLKSEETKDDEAAGDTTKEEDDKDEKSAEEDDDEEEKTDDGDDDEDEDDTKPEDELLWEGEIPENLRDRKHISELLHLDDDFEEKEKAFERVAEIILRDIKKIYENAIKPLETLFKYRDLSNRHFGDPEIFAKPLVVFMGPWSGGKSSTINYLTDNEYTPHSLRTGAEPSPAYFNILMWGNETEVLDGTQLAADYTFSGLQKFGQGLEERLRGLKMPSKLLEKINIVEIPGILEVRKQVQRLFPFNDACQWFIDRADIIVLMYDPAKLDAGPETEAILDQLKGREYQTRIILNKADTVHPEELLRVQSALIWNISPLMSSAQPPAMYTTSLWSHPYESGAPARLLQAQERAFLRDLRSAVDKRIENRIASARRFAVRVRNHAKMVDCYLNTYYNHKTLFGNKKRISDDIIDNPQNYHIYEGLSTLTNISRYDLPDPDVYRDFFRLNPLYEFKKLSDTCTYFRGCPITKLDTAIAYDLPELVSKYKKMSEAAISDIDKKSDSTSAESRSPSNNNPGRS